MNGQPLRIEAEHSDPQDPEAMCSAGLLTVKGAAEFLSVSRSKLYELMNGGELWFVKIGRSRRIPLRAVVELAARGLQGGSRVA